MSLIARDQYGCMDTVTKTIEVYPGSTLFMPNAFTPNGDGINDFFIGKGHLDGITKFQIAIYNRWGGTDF